MTIREGGPEDFETLAHLMRLTHSYPITAETLQERERTRTHPRCLFFAEEKGQIIGYSSASKWSRPDPIRYMVATGVEPEFRRRGIGRQLFEKAHDWAIEQSADQLWSQFLEGREDSEKLLRSLGFEPLFSLNESRMDPTELDLAPFQGTLDAAAATGIRFERYSDYEDSPENRRRLHELYHALESDVPFVGDAEYPGYEVWEQTVYKAHYFDPSLHFLAVQDGQWVGMAVVGEYVPGFHMNTLTGVRRSHRGMRLGLALKIVAMQELADRGVCELRTQNHGTNDAILALNVKLGYQPLPVLHTYAKQVTVKHE